MFIVITGGSGSGKSGFAEDMAVKIGRNRLVYAAAMHPFGKEGQERIKRHREARKNKGFITIEKYTDFRTIPVLKEDTVLLECMSNLLANEMFDADGMGEKAFSGIINGIEDVINRCENLLMVTNDIFSDGEKYPAATERYIKNLAEINKYFFSKADGVYEVVCGIPIRLKGEDIC